MKAALERAGFPGVVEEGGIAYARLSAGSVEFTVQDEGENWVCAVQWPVRASAAQMAGFMAGHPGAVLDIHAGETRLRLRLAAGDAAGLQRWSALAEAMIAQAIRWRRDQRAPGEGM